MRIQVLYLDKLKFDAEKNLANKYLERIKSSGRKVIVTSSFKTNKFKGA